MIASVIGALKDIFLYADLIAHFWVNWNGNVTKRPCEFHHIEPQT